MCIYTHVYTYIYGYSLIKSSLQCLRSCHRIHRSCPRLQEVVHVSQKLCRFHTPLITFVFNCCGMDGSHWVSIYIYSPAFCLGPLGAKPQILQHFASCAKGANHLSRFSKIQVFGVRLATSESGISCYNIPKDSNINREHQTRIAYEGFKWTFGRVRDCQRIQ